MFGGLKSWGVNLPFGCYCWDLFISLICTIGRSMRRLTGSSAEKCIMRVRLLFGHLTDFLVKGIRSDGRASMVSVSVDGRETFDGEYLYTGSVRDMAGNSFGLLWTSTVVAILSLFPLEGLFCGCVKGSVMVSEEFVACLSL